MLSKAPSSPGLGLNRRDHCCSLDPGAASPRAPWPAACRPRVSSHRHRIPSSASLALRKPPIGYQNYQFDKNYLFDKRVAELSSHRHGARRLQLRTAKFVSGVALLSLALGVGGYVAWRVDNVTPTATVDLTKANRPSVHSSLSPGAGGQKVWHRHRHGPVHPRPTPSDMRGTTPTATPTTATSPTPTSAPTSPPSTGPTQPCSGARNTPGGPDPWGSCWPGSGNTGVPAGTGLTSYTGPCGEIRSENITIDAKIVNCDLDILGGGQATIRDSDVNGSVMNNGSGSLLIEGTAINGGSEHSETVGGDNITILSSDLYGNQHEVYCGFNCTVENSWLHDNFNGASLGWHQNGFLSTGGSGYTLEHDSVSCTGGCTSDVALIPNDNISRATITKNLLVATMDVAYCLYPSSGDAASGKPGIVNQITVADNVFQRGSGSKCGQYGPVYGWNTPNSNPGTDGYDNVWSGNTWDNGQSLGP